MHFVEYNRAAALEYASRWAMGRNPAYYDFQNIGGDCTNFASQCLYAGAGVMNYTKDTGWYYISVNNRAAAWTEANYFRKFMLSNKGEGPFAVSVPMSQIEIGDFINLSDGHQFYHTLIVVGFSDGTPLIAAHTNDSYMRPLTTYPFETAYALHILGANKY